MRGRKMGKEGEERRRGGRKRVEKLGGGIKNLCT